MRIVFENEGYRVSAVSGVQAGIKLASADQPDIMLLDLTLPDGSGLDLMQSLRELNALPGATLALTGSEDPVTRDRCLAAGCRSLLVKPVPIQELVAQVRAL